MSQCRQRRRIHGLQLSTASSSRLRSSMLPYLVENWPAERVATRPPTGARAIDWGSAVASHIGAGTGRGARSDKNPFRQPAASWSLRSGAGTGLNTLALARDGFPTDALEPVLPNASCKACRDITSRIELHVLRDMLGHARVALGLRCRRKERRPRTLPLTIVDSSGTERTVELSLADHPTMPMLPTLRVAPSA